MTLDTRSTDITKYWIVHREPSLRQVAQHFFPLYLRLLQEEASYVKLPVLFFSALRHYPSVRLVAPQTKVLSLSLTYPPLAYQLQVDVYEECIANNHLDPRLLYMSEDARIMIRHLLVCLFKPSQRCEYAVLERARQVMVDASCHLGFYDIVWLYTQRLLDPLKRPAAVRWATTTDGLLAYLYTQCDSMINLDPLYKEDYEMRTVALFSTVASRLVREERYKEIDKLCTHMIQVVGVLTPLFFMPYEECEIYRATIRGQ